MEMAMPALKWAAQRGYESFTQARLERVLHRAAKEGVSLEELMKKEEQFAIFVRMVRSLEQCSNNEMADYLADLMIGGIKANETQSRPDLFQILMSALGSLTVTEIKILFLMREHGLEGNVHKKKVDQDKINRFERSCYEKLGLEGAVVGALIDGMIRTGLTSTIANAFGTFRNSNILTPLAKELFILLDYRSRLTQ